MAPEGTLGFDPTSFKRVGFTGTQKGMTPQQLAVLEGTFRTYGPYELHHGDCTGADEQANNINRACGGRTIAHPPTDEKKRAFCGVDETTEAFDYMTRNEHIASFEGLIATPAEYTEQIRSGTWATVRRARKRSTPILFIFPDGSTVSERP